MKYPDRDFVHALAANLKLEGWVFRQAYSLSLEECVLCFANAGAQFYIRILTRWQQAFFFTGDTWPGSESNARRLFTEIEGVPVTRISYPDTDRLFVLHFSNHYWLVFKLYGALTNVILLNGEGGFVSQFRERIVSDQQTAAIDVGTEVGNEQTGHLFQVVESGGNYLLQANEPPGKADQVWYTTANPWEALHEFSRLQTSRLGFVQRKSELIASLNKKRKQLEGNIVRLEEAVHTRETERSPEEIGHILMANQHLFTKGLKTIRLHDFYRDEDITIKLKEDLTPAANAEYYYRKAAHAKKNKQELIERLQEIREQLRQVTQSLEEATKAESMKALKPAVQKQKAGKQEIPFIVFEIEGYEVWVGKNAKNNDLLTTRYAGKNDLWFHARGVAGSHVIVRNPPAHPSPALLEKTAAVAAYYSKAKGSGLAPVAYTPKKFVRKPKGAEPGQVLLSRETVILVEPGLPG